MDLQLLIFQDRIQVFAFEPAVEMPAEEDRMKDMIDLPHRRTGAGIVLTVHDVGVDEEALAGMDLIVGMQRLDDARAAFEIPELQLLMPVPRDDEIRQIAPVHAVWIRIGHPGNFFDLICIGLKACVLVHEKGLLSAEVVVLYHIRRNFSIIRLNDQRIFKNNVLKFLYKQKTEGTAHVQKF